MHPNLKHIPKNANQFLRWFLKEEIAEEVQGDLEEEFLDLLEADKTIGYARRVYWYQVLNYLRPFAIRHFTLLDYNYAGMFKNYFKVSLRHFAKNKSYLIINTLGLGFALSCAVTVYLLFAYNLEFDSFHDGEQIKRIYKVVAKVKDRAGQSSLNIMAPSPLGPEILSTSTGVEKMSRFAHQKGYIQQETNGFSESFAFADSSFFEMFDFPLQQGSYRAFKDRHSIFLSEKLANKLFPNENPIGKSIYANFPNEKQYILSVGGVIDRVPENNSFVFDAIIRYEHFLDIFDLAPDDWTNWRTPNTFFQLSSKEYVAPINQQLNSYKAIRNELVQELKTLEYWLTPFLTKYSDEEANTWYISSPMSLAPLILFGLMVLMILLIASFNLTNTSIALSSKRLKEIGVRKAVGASRSQIIGQFLSETLVIIFCSLIVGLALAFFLIVPQFQQIFSFFDFGIRDLNGLNLFITLILLLFAVAFIAGTYPALYNSRFHPVALVKGIAQIKGTNWLSRILVSTQFALSIIFLIAGTFFIKNIGFQENVDFGYNKERLMVMSIDGEQTFNVMKNHLAQLPKIKAISGTYSHIGSSSYSSPVSIKENSYRVGVLGIGENYLPTVGLKMVSGNSFTTMPTEAAQGTEVIVNEAFVKKVQLDDPIGSTLYLHDTQSKIVGVVENHLDNLADPTEDKPFVYYPTAKKHYNHLVIQANPKDLGPLKKEITNIWRAEFSGKPISIQVQDEVVIDGFRSANIIFGKVFIFLTVLGILMSIAGIYSMTAQNIAKRRKEIGIRKVLGASIPSVLSLLNKEFAWILGFGALLGGLLGSILTDTLLSFLMAHHVPVGFMPVVICALLVFAVGIFTTSSSILRAASTNPIESLKSE